MSNDIKVLPEDIHNSLLVFNVHPKDWKNPEPAKSYNLVVIGAGTAGLVTAAGAAGLGAKVALIEKHLLGGDCLNVGCVPSKCIIRSSRVIADANNSAQFGIQNKKPKADFPAVMERMRRLRSQISHHDSVKRFNELGIDVFLGKAHFSSSNKIEVEGQTLPFKKAVIATGARAIQPAVKGLAEAGFLTNETVFSLTKCPKRLAVIGGGPLGCELAQAFQRLGSQVTIFHKSSHLLNREDNDAAEILQTAFLKEGIQLILNCKFRRVETTNAGKVLYFECGEKEKTVTVDEILIGTGRTPNVEGLNLETVGVKYDSRNGVAVNDYLQTTNPRIYAAGDICLKYKFTHTADATARIVIQNALFFGRKKLSALTIPWCTYTDPEIAHTGMYKKEAEDKGLAVDTFKKNFNEVDRAITDGEENGFIKIHLRKGTDRILGATIVARHAGNMISELTLAVVNNIGLQTIANVIHPYPTQAEAIKQAADAYNRTRITPLIKSLFNTLLYWQR